MYLPHRLKVKAKFGIGELIGLEGDLATVQVGELVHQLRVQHLTPIFRPLSDLLVTIKHNNQLFKPFALLKAFNHIGYHFNVEEKDLREIIEAGKLDMGKMPFWMASICAKWHFDLNGLIELGLAEVFVNEVEQLKPEENA